MKYSGALLPLRLIAALLALHLCLPLAQAAEPSWLEQREGQRQLYVRAQAALADRSMGEFEALVAQLQDYPLLPYLEHAALSARLPALPESAVDDFLARHVGTVLGSRLERQWQAELVKAEQPQLLLRYYNPANASTELTCHALRARVELGDTSAFTEVAALWNVTRSQPNACDPLFAAWMAAGQLTPDIAWQRFSKNLRARNLSLARYISRQMPPREQALAERYLAVDQRPEMLRELDSFNDASVQTLEIVEHGLQRLAVVDALLAMQLWQQYDSRLPFEPESWLATRRSITQRMLLQGHIADAEQLLLAVPALRSETLLEWVLRDALRHQDWRRFDQWLPLLPEGARNSERWRYWQARSLALQGSSASREEAQALYRELARTRNFYGFLAADLIGNSYELLDRPVSINPEEQLALARWPALERAYELYRIGDLANAQLEWQHALRSMNEQQILTAGKLADSWGWHRNGIQAMIQVSYWDDLQLRFPLAYLDLVENAARDTALNLHFLYAITRQESAFMHDVRSSAGAMGLMQLMPATAQETANGSGMRITNQDLLKPEVNIALGSRYLAKMLEAFNGNRILAAAAYNAGPNRVRQWLNQDEGSRLPLDIWIETLPFAETRGYVQNVLAYSVIYGYRMGEQLPLLTLEEAASRL